jgi:hypothetical protein
MPGEREVETMRRLMVILAFTLLLIVVMAAAALAHNVGPCNDGTVTVADAASGATGQTYAQHHIVAAAHEGALGAGGHIPGTHNGFSFCNPSRM